MARQRLLLLTLLAPLACTTSTDTHQYLPPGGSSGGSSGATMPGMVVIAIGAPTDGAVLTANTDLIVSATVDIQNGTDFVDTSSVKVTLTPVSSGAAAANGVLVSGGSDVYTGKLSLGNLAAGMYTLTVTATSSSRIQGSAQATVNIDAGPTITVTSPLPGHAYSGSMSIELTADPGAFSPLMGLTATIGGTTIDLTQQPGTNTYRATVAFGPVTPPPAGVQALPPLSGQQLLDVKASNANGTPAEARVIFLVDIAGPVITMTTPASGQVMGGVINIEATVTDDSGVLDSSVVAVISNQETPLYELALTPDGSGIYSTLFDTDNLTRCPEPPSSDNSCVVFPTISFRAVDLVGNQTVLTYGFAIDNIAPVADLDPPLVRHRKLVSGGYACSWKFDPLSLNQEIGDMPNDNCVVPQIFDLRARIEDDGNRGSEVKVTPLSLVDPKNTNVFVMPATGQPLVVDSDGDGRCDEINPLLLPTSPSVPPTPASGILEVHLSPVPLQGTGDFEPDPSIATDNPPAPCGSGADSAPPPRLCNSFEQPTIAISYYDGQPSIWSVDPIDTTFHCLGNQVDLLANQIPEGWACIAVQTRDLAGNQGVSVPLRVYVQYNAGPGFCPTPPAGAGPPPTCTGTYDKPSKTATLGTCSARKFPRNIEYYCVPGGC